MRILMSGASGLVGSALVAGLRQCGHEVAPLSRSRLAGSAAWWDPASGEIDLGPAGFCDAVIHLAGENVGTRWSAAKKRRIRESRLRGTEILSNAVGNLARPPRVFLSASATGYYGDRGAEWVDEGSAPGKGFLAELCREWEAATAAAQGKGIRVIHLRTGLVLSAGGGALARMLPIFRLGMGGRVGSGRQYWSWVALGDVVGIVEHLLGAEQVSGPVNIVAPHPVTNLEFTRILGRVLGRPVLFPVPAWAARLVLGEMARETLLASARVRPLRLEEGGYAFRFPELEPAVRGCVGHRH